MRESSRLEVSYECQEKAGDDAVDSLPARVCCNRRTGTVCQGSANHKSNPELVSKLTKELNVTPKQAMGGAGAIFRLIKSRLSPAQFSKVAAAVPGMNGFLQAAPAAGGDSGLGSLGSVAPGRAGGLASLTTSFSSLGLSPAMVSKFAPVLQNYIGSRGGSKAAALFADALK